MNKFIALLAVSLLTTPALATEYKSETYENYGYAAGASTMPSSGLKGGLRGAHVAANHHTENSYYPGYFAAPTKDEKK
jgi:hypothetical protein